MAKEIILDKNVLIVSETDAKGTILYANEDFCKIASYTKEELIGQPHNLLRHEDMPKAAFHDLWQTLKSGKVWNGIVKNRCKNNDFYWVNATVYASKQVNGDTRYISIRVKPTQQEILKAETLYQQLKQGE